MVEFVFIVNNVINVLFKCQNFAPISNVMAFKYILRPVIAVEFAPTCVYQVCYYLPNSVFIDIITDYFLGANGI